MTGNSRSRSCHFKTSGALLALLVICLTSSPAFSQSESEDDHLGQIEYELACMPCHGTEGKGDGPDAKKLTGVPSDLTQLSKRNNGTFPFNDLVEIVDGRSLVSAHGEREMPVWGVRYRNTVDTDDSPEEAEALARKRIEALVKYLETIQVQ